MNPPETLEETIDLFERTAKGVLEMDKFCKTKEAHENNVKNATWHLRLVEWLKELQDRRNKENEL